MTRDEKCINRSSSAVAAEAARVGLARRAPKQAGVSAVSTEELAALDVFADIPAQDLAALAANLKPLHSVAGAVLMRQGEKAESFAIITSGRVEIRHVGPDGQIAVTELSPGTIIGEIALLRHEPRTATVIAKDDVRGYVDATALSNACLPSRSSPTGWSAPGSGWPHSSPRSL